MRLQMHGHGRRGYGFSRRHAVTEWGWSFLIKQHLFPAIRCVSTLFGRAKSATCLGGALLSITGSLPTCIPSRSEGGEETHARDVAHGEHAHGEGVKCFRVKMKSSGVQRGTSPFSSGSYSLYRSPKSVGKSNPPEHQAAASFQPSISTGIPPLSVFSPLETTHVLSDCPSGISHTWYRCKLKASRCAHFDPLSSSHAFLSAINPAAGAAESQFSFDFVPLDIEATSARGGPDSHLCLHSLNEAFVTVMILILILIICRG